MALTDPLLTQEETATALRANPRSLERWRFHGDGPRFIKVGRAVRYRRSDLEDWLRQQTRQHTRETPR